MADEEKNGLTEETSDEAPEKTPVEAPATEEKSEAPADEKAGEAPIEEPKDDAPSDEEAEDSPAEEAPAEERVMPSGSDDEELDWKTSKRLERSRLPAEPRPQQSPEDRAAERNRRRSAAAKSRSSYRRKRRAGGEKGEGTAPAERRSAGRKERQGRVVSDRSDKTITVRIDMARRHPAYEKIVRDTSTLHVHDEQNEATEGDLVRVVETRPMSRRKRWRLVEILEKAK